MKIKNIKYILSVLITIFALTSCVKEELNVAESQTTLKQSILTFSTQEEFNKTLAKVNAMSKTERNEWESLKGFKSYGTIASEKYYSIDFSKYNTINEIENDSDVLKYITIFKEDNATFIVPKEISNNERYLMNKDAMYIIGNTAVKYFDGKKVTTNLSNIDILKCSNNYLTALKGTDDTLTKMQKSPILTEENTDRVKIFKKYDDTDSKTSTYMIRVHTAVYTYWVPSITIKQVFFIIQNYKKGFLGIYYLTNFPTTFNFDIRTTDDNEHELDLFRSSTTMTLDSQDFNIEDVIGEGNTYDPDRNCTIDYCSFSVNNGRVSMTRTGL